MEKEEFIKELKIENKLISKIYNLEDVSELKSLSDVFFYTGKGPSNDIMHMGHYLIFNRLAKLSARAPVVIQISADEKRNVKSSYVLYEKAKSYSDNFLNVLKSYFRWDKNNTYVIDNLQFKTRLLLDNCANYISKYVHLKTILGAFGNLNINSAYYVALQLAPVLLFQKLNKNKRCVIITAEDQKPYFLILRDIAAKLKLKKPIIIVLEGLKDIKLKNKMSASNCKNAISVYPTLNEKNLLKSISAPFKLKKPDTEKDYIAYFMTYLIAHDICSAELTKVYKEYKENFTFETKLKVNTILKDHFNNLLSQKEDITFKSFIPSDLNLTEMGSVLTAFEKSYVTTQ